MNRPAPIVALTATLAVLGLGAGCGDLAARGAECVDGGGCAEPAIDAGLDTSGDGGPVPHSDGGADPPSPEDGIPASPDTAGFAAGEAADEVSRGAGSCYDGVDNDDTSAADCEDSGCVSLGSCCVGHGDCCEVLTAEAPLPSRVDFGGACTGDPTTSCLAGEPVVSFGDPSPWVTDGMLYPGGDATYDSGLVIGDPVDLGAMRVVLTTQFGSAAECSGTCLEGAGIAFTEQQSFDDLTHVRPLVGLLSSGSRNDVSLVVSGEIVATWELGEATETWRLLLRPTGRVEVLRGDSSEPEGAAFFPTVSSARLVAYGRNRNPSVGSLAGSRIGSIDMQTSLCDMPTAWRSRDELFVAQPPLTTALDTGTMRAASVARDSERLSMVFEDDGVFMFAQQVAGDGSRFALAHPAGTPVLQPGRPWDEGGIHDPELAWDGAKYVVYYTAVDGTNGRRSIGRAVGDTPATDGFDADETPLIVPDGDVAGYSMPTVVRLDYEASTWIMVVRADLAAGGHQLRVFVSRDDGASFEPYDGGLAGLTTRGSGLSITGFDADEIAQPSLVIHNGAYHLYYAGRRGTRWRIGMLASDELLYWREIADGQAVLAGDGDGRDRVGVAHPDAWTEDGELELFYTGNDGARDTLFRAVRFSAGGSR